MGQRLSRRSYQKDTDLSVFVASSELVVIDHASASCVGSNLDSVSTQLHAAPTPGPFLACVIEVQAALSTFADTVPIQLSEPHGCAGRFSVIGLAPGHYRVIAKASGPDREKANSSDPQSISLSEHDHKTIELTVAPPQTP